MPATWYFFDKVIDIVIRIKLRRTPLCLNKVDVYSSVIKK